MDADGHWILKESSSKIDFRLWRSSEDEASSKWHHHADRLQPRNVSHSSEMSSTEEQPPNEGKEDDDDWQDEKDDMEQDQEPGEAKKQDQGEDKH